MNPQYNWSKITRTYFERKCNNTQSPQASSLFSFVFLSIYIHVQYTDNFAYQQTKMGY